ncbi:MAG TPA: thioredoxin domain-containing protein [Thermoanaerobaculia bacterium]|nr:thioredoxin domain-containing protein [Thermoanaerobaculia bacterium]
MRQLSSKFYDLTPAEARMGRTGRARRLAAPVSLKDHVRGSPLAKVTLVGYGDFTCPDCAKSYQTVKKIQAKMGSLLRYVFRSFTQARLDEKSGGAAEAAESAGAQGKFWEIHDRMFENQGASDQLQLAKHARAVGLDARQFRRDMRGHVHLAKVRVVRKGGVRSGVVQVPTFFINSLQHKSAFGLATLLPAVQAAAGGS